MSGERPMVSQSLDAKTYAQKPYGDAHWMDAQELAALKLTQPGGVLIGQKLNGDLLYFNGEGHIMVFAPTGAGKGIGFVQPNLAEYRGSMVVLDPKGENAIRSIAYRRDVLKQHVMVLDPFGMTGLKTDQYNPLGSLTFADDATLNPWIECLADALIVSMDKKDEHWTSGARKFVAMLMWWLVAHEPPENRNLMRVFDLAHSGTATLSKIAAVMSEGRSPQPEIARMCRASGNWFLGRPERERGYFESVASNSIGWVGDAVWSKTLAGSPTPPLPLKTAPKGMTIYLVLPFHRLERYQSWLRLMVADLLSALYEVQGVPKVGPVLFMLDEAYAGLGRMETLFKAAAAVRSAGARLAFVYQDVAQVNKLYGDAWESLVANSGATLFWSINDLKAADFIRRRCGDETVQVPNNPIGIGQPLMRTEKVFSLPGDEIIALLRNASPARWGRLNVLEDVRFKPRLQPDNRTYGEPVEKPTSARSGFVPVDLDAVKLPKQRHDDEEEEAAPIPADPHAHLREIEAQTGLPFPLLQTLEQQNGRLVLRGDMLGFINERGIFETLVSKGSD